MLILGPFLGISLVDQAPGLMTVTWLLLGSGLDLCDYPGLLCFQSALPRRYFVWVPVPRQQSPKVTLILAGVL